MDEDMQVLGMENGRGGVGVQWFVALANLCDATEAPDGELSVVLTKLRSMCVRIMEMLITKDRVCAAVNNCVWKS